MSERTPYAIARVRFVAAARQRRAHVQHLRHPAARGLNGGLLFVDSAWVGPQDASRVLVCISGTHGAEGAAGSLAQRTWLESDAVLPAGVAIQFIHALNPWGFAHGSRVTENNVDLNRNFVDFERPLPDNPLYRELHDALCPADWTDAALAAGGERLGAVRARAGEDAFVDALNRGQYSHPDGVIFGGTGPEWSNLALHTVLRPVAKGRSHALVLDLHTGLGAFGEPAFLSFDADGSAGRRWARHIAEPFLDGAAAPFEGAAQPDYQGLACGAAAALFADQGADVGRLVVEFGTLPMNRMMRAIQLDRWLRSHGDGCPDKAARRAEVVAAFAPPDPAWWTAVTTVGPMLIDRCLAALSQAANARAGDRVTG